MLSDVWLSTIGNLVGRFFNLLLPFFIIGIIGVSETSDFIILCLTVIQICGVTLANSYTDATIAHIRNNLNLIRFSSRELCLLIFVSIFPVLMTFLSPDTFQISLGVAVLLFLLNFVGLLNGRYAAYVLKNKNFLLPGLLWAYRAIPIFFIFLLSEIENIIEWFLFSLLISDSLRLIHYKMTLNRYGVYSTISKNSYSNFIFFIMLASYIFGFNPMIDRLIASIQGVGGISVYEIADRIYSVFATIISVGLSTVALVNFSGADNEIIRKKMFFKSLKLSFILGMGGVIVGNAILYFFNELFIDIYHQQILITKIIVIQLFILPFFLIGIVSAKFLVAKLRYDLILWSGIIGIIVNSLTSFLGFKLFGLPGIAFGTLVMYVFNSAYVTYWAVNFSLQNYEGTFK